MKRSSFMALYIKADQHVCSYILHEYLENIIFDLSDNIIVKEVK